MKRSVKSDRQAKILELIKTRPIDRQEELLSQLRAEGYNITQATISRDIRELNLVKTATSDGEYRYVSDFNQDDSRKTTGRFETIFKEAVIKIDSAGHIVLVKCFTGMANAACEMFDSMVWDGVVGTLSGDDTFIILTRSEDTADKLRLKLQKFISKD